jgi:hypothetical protein
LTWSFPLSKMYPVPDTLDWEKKIKCFSEARKNPSVSMLLCELSTSFDLAVCLTPCFGRLPALKDKRCPQILIVWASHATRLAEQMTGVASVDCISSRGWQAGKAFGESLAAAVSEKMANCPSIDIVILQLFDNTSFYARTFEGGLIPYRQETNSSAYHIDGDLVSQP